MSARVFTADELLGELRARGAGGLVAVSFRANRSTIWSLTRNATVLNLHVVYRTATAAILDAFATIVRERAGSTAEVERACRVVEAWPPLKPAIEELRAARASRRRNGAGDCEQEGDATSCCATPPQRAYLRALYTYFNDTRFGGLLPDDVPVRLSSRMTSSLGHMLPGVDGEGRPRVVEIALSSDLMLVGNGPERVDTLLHEMAHVADYLVDGNRGHGASWKRWARSAGCRAQTLFDRVVARRLDRREAVTRVPPLPAVLLRREG